MKTVETGERAGFAASPLVPPESPRNVRPGNERQGRVSRIRLTLIALGILILLAVLFVAGYLPRVHRERDLATELATRTQTLPEVTVVQVRRAPAHSDLLIPANITPLTEAVINARADGYLHKRYVDIGDRVKQDQVLAEIEAPELDRQIEQAQAALSQSRAALAHSQHALAQARANEHMAELTAQRWKTLSDRGVVSRQEYDQNQTNYEAQQAAVELAQADVRSAEDNIKASDANLQRLQKLQSYERVTAPFAGIVTARNVDVGALISSTGTTPLFRIAQSNVLRIMVDVPEQSAPYIRVGEPAGITLQEFPGRIFTGKVTRTANSLDPNTRTLLTEVQVRNDNGELLPNMFAKVKLIGARRDPTLIIPGDAIVIRADGTRVAVLREGNRVHFQKVELGRDYGVETEISSGLSGDEMVITSPTDEVREGVAVHPTLRKPAAAQK